MSRIERNPFLLRHLDAAGIPCVIGELEQHADRPHRVHLGIAEICRGIELAVHPDPRAAVAARLPGCVEVGALAMVLVIVVHHVPVIDHQAAHAFCPHVHGTADQLLFGVGFQLLAVHAVRDAVVLPGEIVAPFAHESAVGLVVLGTRQLPLADGQQEDARLPGREVGLKQ